MSDASLRRRFATSTAAILVAMPVLTFTSVVYADDANDMTTLACNSYALFCHSHLDTISPTVVVNYAPPAAGQLASNGAALLSAEPRTPSSVLEPIRIDVALQTGVATNSGVTVAPFSDTPPPPPPASTSEPVPGSQVIPPSTGGVLTTGADLRDLDLALGDRPIYGALLRLQDSIIDMQRPVANLVARQSTQSDGLDISQAELSQDIFFSQGLGRLRFGLQSALYTPTLGDDILEESAGLDGTYRINDAESITGSLWLNNLNSHDSDGALLPTYDLFFTLWPNDYFRIDIDSSRRTFDNIISLQKRIVAENLGASVDFTPSNNYRFTLRANGSYYSDVNEQESGEIEIVRRIYNTPTIEVGVLGTAYNFTRQLNDGYFNPKDYYSASGLFRIQANLIDHLSVEFAASGGIEDAIPYGDKPLGKVSLQLVYNLGSDWTFDGGAAYFSSRESNSSGFARTSINIGIHRKF